jgi:hypothetical protein
MKSGDIFERLLEVRTVLDLYAIPVSQGKTWSDYNCYYYLNLKSYTELKEFQE